MASFRLGPLRSPNRSTFTGQTQPFSIDPSQLQVSLEQTQCSSAPIVNRSSGKSSPLRGRCVKEYEEQLQQLQHENFNLKLRVFLLEERMGKALGRGDAADIIKNNIELKVENESLKKSLAEKNELLAQASTAIEDLESEQRSSQTKYDEEKKVMEQKLQTLQKELSEIEQAQIQCQRMNLLPDESTDLYAQAFGSFALNPHQLTCTHSDHRSKEEVDELLIKISELESNIEGLKSEAAVRAMEMEKMRTDIEESQEEILRYRQRIRDLECDVNEQETKLRQLEAEEAEKDTKIDCLLQQLETRHLELKDKDTKIQSLSDDLNAKEPEIEVKVQEIVEKDKIIEEKQYQLEQQNKILVEIQITLDEKQKQIEELESALAEKKKKVDELENSLSKAGRTLQGFVTDIQKKEKELEQLKNETKKKDKRIKDLTAELKEVKDMLNKAKWEAETSGREDNVKAMAEEENERLWAELEEKNRLLLSMEREKEQLKQDCEKLQVTLQSISQKDEAIAQADRQIAALNARNEELNRQISSKERKVYELEKELADLRTTTAGQGQQDINVVQLPQKGNAGTSPVKSKKVLPTSRHKGSSSSKIQHSVSGHAKANIELSKPLVAAETSIINENDQSAELRIPEQCTLMGDLQNELFVLKESSKCKEKEIEQLRKELSVSQSKVLHLSAMLTTPDKLVTCRAKSLEASDGAVTSSVVPVQHSTNIEENALKAEQLALKLQLAACIQERKELTDSVEQLKSQLTLLSTGDSKPLIAQLRKQLEESQSRATQSEQELNKVRSELRNLKRKSESHGQDYLRLYKREVTVLRKRLADSTNACDILRTRLEEMADFLEEILNMDEQGLLNLSNWSAKRRQNLQHSILQSRELSRSLSQSLMIGVDLDSIHEGLQSSSSMSASSWSAHGESGNASEQLDSSRENLNGWERSSNASLPPPPVDSHQDTEVESDAVTRLSTELAEKNRALTDHGHVIDKLRNVVAQLEEQVKQRDVEIAWLNMEREKNAIAVAATVNANKSVQTESNKMDVTDINSKKTPLPISSTPYHHNLGQPIDYSASPSIIIPVTNEELPIPENRSSEAPSQIADRISSELCNADRALVTAAAGLLRLNSSVNTAAMNPDNSFASKAEERMHTLVAPSSVVGNTALKKQEQKVEISKNARSSGQGNFGASESEAWSEPDRTVSIARIGLPTQDPNNFSPLPSNRKSRTHSASGLSAQSSYRTIESEDSSDASKQHASRRSRSDASEVKRVHTKLRATEQENIYLRSQLNHVVSCLRTTWDTHMLAIEKSFDDEEESKGISVCDPSLLMQQSGLYGTCDSDPNYNIATAQYILEALQNHLQKVKENLKRKEEKLKESKDMVTQLEFKVKEKYFKNRENELRLKEAEEKLEEKSQQVNHLEQQILKLETKYHDADSEWNAKNHEKDMIISELKQNIDAKETELRNADNRSRIWEKSFLDCQDSLRQLQSDFRVKEELWFQSKATLEQRISGLEQEITCIKEEHRILEQAAENLKLKVKAAEEAEEKYASLVVERDNLISQIQSFRDFHEQPCGKCQFISNATTIAGATVTNVAVEKKKKMCQKEPGNISGYVSDHGTDENNPPFQRLPERNNTAGSKSGQIAEQPRGLHLSPDLGIDSDPSRLSSLEHAAVDNKAGVNLVNAAAWRLISQDAAKKPEESHAQENILSPDVLAGQMSCANCQVLQRKYAKAKQTLAVTLEKLQAANLRKEKVDRALNKELGKTHNILCQARGLLEQANQNNG